MGDPVPGQVPEEEILTTEEDKEKGRKELIEQFVRSLKAREFGRRYIGEEIDWNDADIAVPFADALNLAAFEATKGRDFTSGHTTPLEIIVPLKNGKFEAAISFNAYCQATIVICKRGEAHKAGPDGGSPLFNSGAHCGPETIESFKDIGGWDFKEKEKEETEKIKE